MKFNENPGMYTFVLSTGNEMFEKVNIKRKKQKGKIEILSLRVNKLRYLISKDF